MVGHLRPEQSGIDRRGDPVALHSRLAERVHHQHARSSLSRLVQILHRDRLVVRRVRAEEDDQLRIVPVAVRAGGSRHAERRLQTARAWRVAEACGVVHVVAAEIAHDLLRRVIDLVGHAAARDVHGGAPGGELSPARAHISPQLPPADAREARLSLAAPHGAGETPHLAKLLRALSPQRRHIGKPGRIAGGHRVQPEQLEPHHAQVDPVDRPVAQSRRPERAAVAAAAREDLPGVGKVVAVLPRDPGHLPVMVRLDLSDAEGDPTVLQVPDRSGSARHD